MNSLAVLIKPKKTVRKKILVEINAEQFERLAANLGFFGQEFLQSLRKAEQEYRQGKIKKIKSLKELR
ncbi:MAG: hypothetical protein AAB772_00240 [Patescibacteria group bacterium]